MDQRMVDLPAAPVSSAEGSYRGELEEVRHLFPGTTICTWKVVLSTLPESEYPHMNDDVIMFGRPVNWEPGNGSQPTSTIQSRHG